MHVSGGKKVELVVPQVVHVVAPVCMACLSLYV